MKIAVIRVDASIKMGSGHVMRCLTLAEELRDTGYQVVFVCRQHEGNMIDFIKSKGYSTKTLKKPFLTMSVRLNELAHSNWLGVSQGDDALETLAAVKDYGSLDLLVVDHYGLDTRWESQLRQQANKIFVIDDLADRNHDCDVLLDQNYYLNNDRRYEGLVSKDCIQLLGPKYALLRKEFREARKKAKVKTGPVKRIFVFFGGSDPTNETTKALKAFQLLNRDDIIVDVVVGGSNPHQEDVKKLAHSMVNVHYYCQITNMAELMLKADLAIGAGGSSTWERMFLGIPTISLVIAKNQYELSKTLEKKGLVWNIGFREDISIYALHIELKKVLNNPKEIKNKSRSSLSFMNCMQINIARILEGCK